MWTCPHDGMPNDDNSAVCAFCGNPRPQEAGPDVAGTCGTATEVPESSVLVLTDIRTKRSVEIDHDGIVGREGDFDPDAFEPTVSRKHLLVACRDGVWTIRHVGRNSTRVFTQGNEVSVESGMEYPLYGGELLKLGGMYLDVLVEAIEPDDVPGEVPANLVEGWFVDCPRCGTSIRVVDANARVRECPRCTDRRDKELVRRIRPIHDSRPEESFVDAG